MRWRAVWHRLKHRFGWVDGWIEVQQIDGVLYAGLRCDECGEVWHFHRCPDWLQP